MGRKKGLWVKPREPHRLSPEGKAAIRPQTERIKEAGGEIREKCSGLKGTGFKRCRSEVLERIFGKKEK